MPLVVLRSPYRSVVAAVLEYLDHLQRQMPRQLITIILPEFVPARKWQHFLHNQTALLIKGAAAVPQGDHRDERAVSPGAIAPRVRGRLRGWGRRADRGGSGRPARLPGGSEG